MSAVVFGQLAAAAASTVSNFSNLLAVVPKGQFQPINDPPIIIPVTLEETNTDLLTVTDHPVEAGANISDHSYYRPAELVMRCGWSNSSAANLVNAVSNLVSSGSVSQFAGLSGLSSLFGSSPAPISAGGMTTSDYVAGIYSQLLAMQQSRQPFTVVTSIRQYLNMLMTSLVVTRDQRTSQALMVTATMRQVILVNTVATFLAPIAVQANPQNTAEIINQGQGALLPNVTPSPGPAANPASNWAASLGL